MLNRIRQTGWAGQYEICIHMYGIECNYKDIGKIDGHISYIYQTNIYGIGPSEVRATSGQHLGGHNFR